MPANIETDLDVWRALADGHDARGVAALLGERPDDLLSDLNNLDSGFDEWLAVERARRNEQRHAFAMAVAWRALDRGETEDAYAVALRLLAIEPFDEAATSLAMEARGRSGDRDGLRRVFGRYSDALSREFDVAPPPNMVALLARLSTISAAPREGGSSRPPVVVDKQGGRPVAPDVSTKAEDPADPVPTPDMGPVPRRKFFGRGSLLATAVLVAAAGTGSVLWFGASAADSAHTIAVQRLNAAPNDNTAAALGDGFAADLSRMIVGTGNGLKLVDLGDSGASATHADFVVASDARSNGRVIHASVRLLDRSTESIL